MRAAFVIALAFATASTAVAKPQQVGTGSNIPGRLTSAPGATSGKLPKKTVATTIAPADAAFARGRAVARCVVSGQSADVQSVLASRDEASLEAAAQKLSALLGKCAIKGTDRSTSRVELKLGGSTYYGLLAEAWISKRGLRELSSAPYDPGSEALLWLAKDDSDYVLLRFADCLAHREPARVGSLVRSTPMSTQEAADFAGIQPMLASCLDSKVTLSATKSKLRLALAAALYQRSLDPIKTPIAAAH